MTRPQQPASQDRRPLPVRARRAFAALVLLTGLPYALAVGTIYLAQRSLLFPGSRPGSQAAAIVVPGGERVTVATADGERLAAWHVAPEPGRPVFLFLHGNGGALEFQTGRWSRLRDAGAGVLAISYRGYPGSSGRPSEAGLHADARAGYEWLRARYPADRIVVHGASLGTAPAVRLAAEVPVRAVVLEAPFTAAVDVAAEAYPWVPVRTLMLDQFRTYEWISKVTAPLLIVHGAQDRTIPVAQAERLYLMANAPKHLVRLPAGDHNSLVRDGLYGHVWPFLEQQARVRPAQ